MHEDFEAGNIEEDFKEANFYFKYFGYSEDNYIHKFSENWYSLGLYDSKDFEEEYQSSYFMYIIKFHKGFSKEFTL